MTSDPLIEARYGFKLETRKLTDIARIMERRIVVGLNRSDRQITCLPAYIPMDHPPAAGRALCLDIGGTRLRAALLEIKDGTPVVMEEPKEGQLPADRSRPLTREQFLTLQGDLIAELDPPPDLPLGYCFSFPAVYRPDRDAELIRWTKELSVADMAGRPVGALLVDHLRQRGIPCGPATVINDSMASLIAGCTGTEWDALIALIVGTGFNMAALMERKMLPKIKEDPAFGNQVVINLEAGNFNPPHLTPWDEELDARSDNPGSQQIEKAVSGGYLGTLMKLVLPGSPVDPSMGSAELARLAYDALATKPQEAELARRLLDRSARLVAAALAGLISAFNNHKPRTRVRIITEGGLINNAPGYRACATETLDCLLDQLKLGHIRTELVQLPHVNLAGSAIAALAGLPQGKAAPPVTPPS